MPLLGQIALMCAVGLPLLTALMTGVIPLSVRIGMWWASAGSALLTTLVVLSTGSVVTVGAGSGHTSATGLVADGLTVWLLLLLCSVGALVQSYAGRYLHGDAHATRFEIAAAVTVSAMAVVATSATIAGMAGGWVVAGLGFAAAAGYRRDLPGVPGLVRKITKTLLIGDAALVVATVIIFAKAGNVSLRPQSLEQAVADLGIWHAPVAVLIGLAALARCAQLAFRSWLRLTVSAPTPVSALLHAGVVNGGGIFFVRLGPITAWTPALVGVGVVAAIGAAWSSLVMARHPDIKGQLASSTSAQMGFMLVQCCVGAYASALVHMLGHGLYKAALFLSSGSAVRTAGAPRPPRYIPTPARIGAAAAAASAATAAASPGLIHGNELALVVFAALTAAALAGGWWLRRPVTEARRWLWPLILLVAASCYGTVVAGLGAAITPALPPADTGLPTWSLLILAAVTILMMGFTALRTPLAARFQARLLDAAVIAPADWRESIALTRPGTKLPATASQHQNSRLHRTNHRLGTVSARN